MGLEDIVPDDAGDAVGGRPPENTTTRPEHEGNAYTEADDNEEYWREVFDENVEGDEPTTEELLAMSSYAAVRSSVVKQKLTEYGIYEYTQDDVDRFSPTHMQEGNWAGGDGQSISGSTSSEDSGLLNLVDDAKE